MTIYHPIIEGHEALEKGMQLVKAESSRLIVRISLNNLERTIDIIEFLGFYYKVDLNVDKLDFKFQEIEEDEAKRLLEVMTIIADAEVLKFGKF